MRSLKAIEAPAIVKSLAYVAIVIILSFILFLFLPWRQTVTGEGKVTVFSPMQRPQVISSQIDAQISKWHINEGQVVNKGDLLLELIEVNAKYLDKNQLTRLEGQKIAALDKRSATERLITSLEQQIGSLTRLQDAAMPNADLKIQQSTDKLRASTQKYKAAEQSFKTAELNFSRRKQLFDKGLSSRRDYELAELKFIETKAELEGAEAQLDIANRAIAMSQLDLSQVSAETSLKIQEAEAKLAQSYEKRANINSDVFKLEIEISNFESRISQRKVYAPVDGQVVRIKTLGQAEIIKAGSELATIVPTTIDQAVELYISDYFVPLVSIGREVRLQFSGWPALQFSGWPSAAMGTFAGKITAIDASADAQNRYRILIQPDYQKIGDNQDLDWPSPDILRPGTKALGWVILDEVPMWYELWRILNGFPPTIMYSPSKTGVPKLKTK